MTDSNPARARPWARAAMSASVSQQREAGEPAPLDEPFLEPRDTSKLEKKEDR